MNVQDYFYYQDEGNLLGEYEFLNFKNSQCSVLAYTPTEVISISRSDLQILPQNMIDQFKSASKPYPPDVKLRKIFLQGMYWKNFKVDILSNMNIEQKNRRNIDSQKIMDRDQPYEIPHEAYLHVDDDSFNQEVQEDDNDLEKQVFQPLDKLFAQEKKKTKIDQIGINKESQLNESIYSPINPSRSNSQNISQFLKNTPLQKSKQQNQTLLLNKNKIHHQLSQNFNDIPTQPSIKFGSKTLLPPLNKNNHKKNIPSDVQSQDKLLNSIMSIPQIPQTEEEKKNLILKQLFNSLNPKREQNQFHKNKRNSEIKIEESVNPTVLLQKKKDNKQTLHRYLTPKISLKNMSRLNQDDIILTERAYKHN